MTYLPRLVWLHAIIAALAVVLLVDPVHAQSSDTTWYRQVCTTEEKLYVAVKNEDGELHLQEYATDDASGDNDGNRSRRERNLLRKGQQHLDHERSADNDHQAVIDLESNSLYSFTSRALEAGQPVDEWYASALKDEGINGRARDSVTGNDDGLVPPLLFRRCHCFVTTNLFCPTSAYGDADVLCGIPADYSNSVDCYDYSIQRVIVRNSWPLVVLWYAGLTMVCFCTLHGRSAGGYIHSIFPFLCCTSRQEQHRRLQESLDRIQAIADQHRNQGTVPPMPPRFRLRLWQQAQLDRAVVAFARHIRNLEFLDPIRVNNNNNNNNNTANGGIWSVLLGSGSGGDPNVTVAPSLVLKTTIYKSSHDTESRTKPSEHVVASEPTTTASTAASTTSSTVSFATSPSMEPLQDHVETKIDMDTKPQSIPTSSDKDMDDSNDDNANKNDTPTTLEQSSEDTPAAAPVASSPSTNIDTIDDFEDDNDDDPSCAICFVPLEDGDRVGDLSCGHNSFHVDCLKTWLPRRNTCPLCQAPHVAKFQLAPVASTTDTANA